MTIGKDKWMHAGVCFVMCFGLCWLTDWWLATLFTLFVGMCKEFYDLMHPDKHSAEWADFGADTIGALVGLGLWFLIHSLI